jgi:H+/Cl- antiporter ClcA
MRVVSCLCALHPAGALLGAGYRTPLAASVWIAETVGGSVPGFRAVPGILAVVAAEIVMGSASASEEQR